MKIWKYQLKIRDSQTIAIPKEAYVLSVGEQRGSLCMWAAVDPSNELEDCEVVIIGTGNWFDDEFLQTHRFIGTVVIEPFVWHVFIKEGVV